MYYETQFVLIKLLYNIKLLKYILNEIKMQFWV